MKFITVVGLKMYIKDTGDIYRLEDHSEYTTQSKYMSRLLGHCSRQHAHRPAASQFGCRGRRL